MKKIILLSIALCFFVIQSHGQKVRWPYALNGNAFGAGVPAELGKGESILYPADYNAERDKEGNQYFHYQFMPIDAQQLMIMEVESPGAILKVVLGHKMDKKSSITKEVIYTGHPHKMETDFYIRNINFQIIKNITDVWIYFDFDHTKGMNRIAGVALTDFMEPYSPTINLFEKEPFGDELMDMNDDVMYPYYRHYFSPVNPQISEDNKYIYFSSMIKDLEKQIYDYQTTVDEGVEKIFKCTIGSDGKISMAEQSNYNLKDKISTHSSISSISQDNKVMYINTMDRDRNLHIYRVYTTKDKDDYTKYHYEKIKFGKYLNKSEYINDIMSFDQEYLIVTIWKKDKHYEKFERDLYVTRKTGKNQYGEFIRMGDDINTLGAEVPCFLAADNKTLYFASDGHLGYGKKDIYVSRRLDNTWQNWSQPVNLGPRINSGGTENYFIVNAKGEYAYVVKWDTDKKGFSDLFRVIIKSPKLEDKVEQTIKH